MEQMILIANMQEKKIGRGEDSDPISFSCNNTILLGVFDGMGGAGSSEHPSDFSHDGIDMTKAYIGARIVRDSIEEIVKKDHSIVWNNQFKDTIKEVIRARYEEEKEKYPSKSKALLRSALIKEYPTTLALTAIKQLEQRYIVDSYWAGDSRNYLWTQEGLFQISIDDLQGELDPLQNLQADAPISNCIQADAPFTINHKRINLENTKKFVVISATDGCFGYYSSPMDFENTLITSLRSANSVDKWNETLTKSFEAVSGDDFSFSIAAIGFKDFKEFRKLFRNAQPATIKTYGRNRYSFEQLLQKRAKLDKEIAEISLRLQSEIKDIWAEYKNEYFKYLRMNEEG